MKERTLGHEKIQPKIVRQVPSKKSLEYKTLEYKFRAFLSFWGTADLIAKNFYPEVIYVSQISVIFNHHCHPDPNAAAQKHECLFL